LQKFLTVGSCAALLFIYGRQNPTAVDKFVHDIFDGKGPAWRFVDWLNRSAAKNYGRVHELTRNANLILALNIYCTGKHPRGTGWKSWDALGRFPTVMKPK
jgi:hypothetical protein